jgi:hypothetical protein
MQDDRLRSCSTTALLGWPSDAPELSDVILKAFMARREFLRTSEAARSRSTTNARG